MKKLYSILFALFACTLGNVFAQCNEFYQIDNGSAWEMETYNAKGKLSAVNKQKVTAYSKNGSGFAATINSAIYNEKGKEQMKGDLEMKCENGVVYIDMRNFIPEEQMKNMGNYEMKVESENLEIPSSLSVGQTLKDGSVTLTATNSPLPMNMNVMITERKVVAKESITTPAGTFDTYKITSKATFKNKFGVSMTFEFSNVEWLAPKVGVVKTESYNAKNGKLNGYSILTKRT
jgi:hypothetical protein